jgi:hypothetical protein
MIRRHMLRVLRACMVIWHSEAEGTQPESRAILAATKSARRFCFARSNNIAGRLVKAAAANTVIVVVVVACSRRLSSFAQGRQDSCGHFLPDGTPGSPVL